MMKTWNRTRFGILVIIHIASHSLTPTLLVRRPREQTRVIAQFVNNSYPNLLEILGALGHPYTKYSDCSKVLF